MAAPFVSFLYCVIIGVETCILQLETYNLYLIACYMIHVSGLNNNDLPRIKR